MRKERRRAERFPIGFYVQQIINDKAYQCFTTDLSSIGIYLERPVQPVTRNSNIIQIELPLPDTSDSLWIAGEVIYDRIDSLFHGSAIRFTTMARKHQRMLREWLREYHRWNNLFCRHPLQRIANVSILRPSKQLATAA